MARSEEEWLIDEINRQGVVTLEDREIVHEIIEVIKNTKNSSEKPEDRALDYAKKKDLGLAVAWVFLNQEIKGPDKILLIHKIAQLVRTNLPVESQLQSRNDRFLNQVTTN
ncbi:MAG: hypothetical protein UX87_C0031G0001, partial [Candidatus Amesbacteria bacterium GW2011_GWA1_47_16]